MRAMAHLSGGVRADVRTAVASAPHLANVIALREGKACSCSSFIEVWYYGLDLIDDLLFFFAGSCELRGRLKCLPLATKYLIYHRMNTHGGSMDRSPSRVPLIQGMKEYQLVA
jgi:hypothetical protein